MQVAAQQQAPSPAPPARDTAFTKRTIIKADSMPAPWRAMGRLSADDAEANVQITKLGMRKLQYGQLAEALYKATPWAPLSHGGFGQHDGLSVMGGLNVDLSVSMNGRSTYEPWSGLYQLIQAQPAGLERVEILTGTDAVGLAPSMTLTALNMQAMIHNSATPFTSLWYHQGGGDIVAMDGTFSQNVAENVNVTVGVRRSGARGRYTNTGFDIWNVRSAVRWTVSNKTHLNISYELASLNSDIWGGIRQAGLSKEFTEDAAPPVNTLLRDETRRHDLTISLAQHLTDDSSSVLTASAYGTYNAMLRLRDSTLNTSAVDTMDQLVIRGGMAGALLRLDQHIGEIHLRLGTSADLVQNDSSVYAVGSSGVLPQVFGHVVVPLAPSLLIRAAARASLQFDRFLIGAGAGLDFNAGSSRYRVDVATSQRAPTLAEGSALTPEQHVLLSAGGSWFSTNMRATATIYGRLVSDPIVSSGTRTNEVIYRTTSVNAASRSIIGGVAEMTWRIGNFEFRPVVRLTYSTTDNVADQRFPLAMADLSAAYVYEVGRNSVRLGVSGTALSSAQLPQFVGPSWTYVAPVVATGSQYNGLSVFMSAQVGNANIRASFDNILGQRWYTTSLAPEIVRSIRLSVDWSFFD